MNKISSKIIFVIIFTLFFILSFLTLKDYGISWDEPTHFKRGQGYLWFLFTGDNDYQKLPPYDLERARSDPSYHQRSFYQDDKQNAAFYRTIDGTHPTLNGISASLSNYIFYQKLGLLGDVESYHLFEVLVSSLGVAFLFLMVYESFGLGAAILSTFFYASFPLFFAESHFNIKDPVVTSFIIAIFYYLWKGVSTQKNRYLIYASLFSGAALGTKFNVVFLPLIAIPWFLSLRLTYQESFFKLVKSTNFILLTFLIPVIAFIIFFITYPFLWTDPYTNTLKVFTYYEKIGIDSNPTIRTEIIQWLAYPAKWVIFTTPPIILAGFLIGLFNVKKLWKNRYNLFLLWFIWLFIPILRVSIPGTTLYGGVRQIMEYIPPLSMMAGTGIFLLVSSQKKILQVVIIFFCISVSLIPIIKLHPNENVYFNFLVNGLPGAVESKLPSAGNSFGNAYKQGLNWINHNAPLNSKLSLLQGKTVNFPHYQLRPDISFANTHWSGINRNSEYIMELTYNYETKADFYAWEYAEKILEPVYEVKADNTAILKIWKNDWEHTKAAYRLKEVELKNINGITTDNKSMVIDLNSSFILSRLIINFESTPGCQEIKEGFVETSQDNKQWLMEKDYTPYPQVTNILPQEKNQLNYFFPAREARFIRIRPMVDNPCLLLKPKVTVYTLEEGFR